MEKTTADAQEENIGYGNSTCLGLQRKGNQNCKQFHTNGNNNSSSFDSRPRNPINQSIYSKRYVRTASCRNPRTNPRNCNIGICL